MPIELQDTGYEENGIEASDTELTESETAQ